MGAELESVWGLFDGQKEVGEAPIRGFGMEKRGKKDL